MRNPVPPIARIANCGPRTGGVCLYGRCRHCFRCFLADENGATAIEYGIIVAAIAAAIIGTVFLIGADIAAIFEGIGNKMATRGL